MKYFKNVEIFEKVLLIRGPLGDVYENWSRFKWLLNGRTNYLNDIRLSRTFISQNYHWSITTRQNSRMKRFPEQLGQTPWGEFDWFVIARAQIRGELSRSVFSCPTMDLIGFNRTTAVTCCNVSIRRGTFVYKMRNTRVWIFVVIGAWKSKNHRSIIILW